jgi:hypothetical protein
MEDGPAGQPHEGGAQKRGLREWFSLSTDTPRCSRIICAASRAGARILRRLFSHVCQIHAALQDWMSPMHEADQRESGGGLVS